MKVFIASIATETNTYSAFPTGRAAFEMNRGKDPVATAFRPHLERWAADEGHALAFGLTIFAQPAGATVRSAWEALRDELLADLRAAMPVDAVVLPLHGAMVAEGCDDCEGELLERVRAIVGPRVPIGVELDLHCHFTERMRRNADILVAYKEYPHTDALDRLAEVWRLTLDTAAGRIRPVTAVADCRMVGLWHTTREPMSGFVRRMQSFEGQGGVLSVSFGHGFPFADVPEAGAKVWVVTNDDLPRAQALADELARELFAMRDETRSLPMTVAAALDAVQAAPPDQPLVLADVADNAGGGASSDSTFILAALRERGIGNVAIGPIWDMGAVQICRESGVGSTLVLRVGGKCGPTSGPPVDLPLTVRAIKEDHTQSLAGLAHFDCGPSAWVQTADGIDLVLTSIRHQGYGTDLFTGLGIDLTAKRVIVVKSTQHFHAAFAPLAQQVLYVDTPGLLRSDFEHMDYRRRPLNYWPRVEDPWVEPAGETAIDRRRTDAPLRRGRRGHRRERQAAANPSPIHRPSATSPNGDRMNPLNRRAFCRTSLVAAGAWPLATLPARAQTQPLELARILIGFPAGSGADAMARALAQRLAPTYAKQVIIENRTGAGGQIAATALKTAPADGSTILFTPLAVVGVYPHTHRSLPYSVDTDFAPVTLGVRFDVALAVGTAVPESVKSVPEFLAWAKANPSRANVGSPAPGSPLHFTIAELTRLSKVELQHVPYRGTVAAIPDLISGTLPAMVSSLSEFVRHIPEGKIRVLGISGGKRSPFAPQVATFSEQGLKELEFEDYFGFYVPARTPAAQIQALNAAIRQGMAHPSVKEVIDTSAALAATGTPEELTSTLRAYSRRWEAVVKAIGFKAD